MAAARDDMSALCLYVLAAMLALAQAHDLSSGTHNRPPSLETFANYEDMQRYFANRNLRSLRLLENPTDDSYINAYNYHNEDPALGASSRRPKRSGATNPATSEYRSVPTEPKLIRFEIADAVDPSDEVKALIRQHRSREEKKLDDRTRPQQPASTIQAKQPKLPKAVAKHKPIAKGRVKRASTQRQPANFQVHLIKFEATDAREPDAQTRNLIKRMRALELENGKVEQAPARTVATSTIITPSRAVIPVDDGKRKTRKTGTTVRVKKIRKRVRRSAPQTAPQMIKFELEDAKEPDEAIKALLQQSKTRESKEVKEPTLLTKEKNVNATRRSQPGVQADSTPVSHAEQQSHESKRVYVYKEPPHGKAKKSINSLPHEVQKIISQLMKENSGAKAYVKYIPSQQFHQHAPPKMLYGLKVAQPVYEYGSKLYPNVYTKYATPLQKAEPLQVRVHAVPVVEKVRYVYAPVATHEHSYLSQQSQQQPQQQPQQIQHQQHYVVATAPKAIHLAAPTHMTQPIVVQEPKVQLPPATEVHHHTYAADLTHINTEEEPAQAIKDVAAPQFRPSKPDPTYHDYTLTAAESENAESLKAHNSLELPADHYKYDDYHSRAPVAHEASEAEPAAPVIKIEYHAPPDPLKDNYKELQEFKELSALMGKSPEDQIHGLTYLLAKEMQNKLKQQRHYKQLDLDALEQRPQENTSPILFHPEQQSQEEPQRTLSSAELGKLSTQQGTLIGMARSKLYVPIVETPAKSEVESQPVHQELQPHKSEYKAPEASSFVEYSDLSLNYDVDRAKPPKKLIVEQVIHHPTAKHHGSLEYGPKLPNSASAEHSAEVFKLGSGESSKQHHGINFGNMDALQYASKYTFGYRIRDFHTGNDFGHEQNRDLNGVTRGQYHILLPDGRVQNVIYHADDTGFHADVSFATGH